MKEKRSHEFIDFEELEKIIKKLISDKTFSDLENLLMELIEKKFTEQEVLSLILSAKELMKENNEIALIRALARAEIALILAINNSYHELRKEAQDLINKINRKRRKLKKKRQTTS